MRPLPSRYRRLDPERLAATKAEFAAMESQGIICRSKSSWSSPLHMGEKSDSSWRPCGDYQRLNLVTKRDMYPPPHMEDLSAQLADKKVFSKMDLRKGYYQMPVAPQDVPKTAVITPAPPADTPAPPVVILAAKRTYAEAAATPALDGATHVYLQRGDVGP